MSYKPFKICKFNCGGLDIHKNKIQAAVQVTDRETLEAVQHNRAFGALNSDLEEMCAWLEGLGCRDVAMESTGKYWIPVANILEDHGIAYKLVHPKYVKAVAAHKTDRIDAGFIASLNACDMCGPGSVVFAQKPRYLRSLARRYWKLGSHITAEKNRYQNCLTTSNIGIASVFSDPFGKSAQAVMEELLSSETIQDEKILSLVSNKCKNKDKILDAVHGSKITPDDKFLVRDISSHIGELSAHRSSVLTEILTWLQDKMDTIVRLTQIPGIEIMAAVLIVCEIGLDMSFWESARQLASWAGLTPRNNESNGRKKSTRITKAGLYLKPLLVQCALAATRDKDGYFGIKYRRIKKRRGHKKAIIAICRMMLVCIYHMIRDGSDFKPHDYDELMNPRQKRTRSEMRFEEAVRLLTSQGYSVTMAEPPRDMPDPPTASP